jgi:serine/threonine protein kinase
MDCDVVEKWLQSGRPAVIGPHRLKPIEHTYAKGKPLSLPRGQAEAFFLTDERGNWWILKKFRPSCTLDPAYLTRVASLLPRESGFMCGTERQILTTGALQKATGHHHSKDLDQWLEGTVLMPQVDGVDWACLADDLRAGQLVLEPAQRLNLCLALARLIELLETHQCCHRDLSCGNIFIDLKAGATYLIDFDSFFHPSLPMPNATTCGTAGYTAAYLWTQGNLDPRRTWCEKADRYALALLNVEMLLVNRGTEATGEGGIFDQEELKNRSGRRIDATVAALQARYPQATTFLLQAIHSGTPADCPSPQAWSSFCQSAPGVTAGTPKLADLPDYTARIADLLARSRPPAPLWPAPSLKDVPVAIPLLPMRPKTVTPGLTLPPDAWASGSATGRSRGGRP